MTDPCNKVVRSGYEDLFNRFPELSVSMADPSIRQNADSAVVVGVETQKVRLPSGEVASALLPATNVFVKRNGRWLMVHHHSSRPPQ
jgi:ketosteroid isomerase-like protein